MMTQIFRAELNKLLDELAGGPNKRKEADSSDEHSEKKKKKKSHKKEHKKHKHHKHHKHRHLFFVSIFQHILIYLQFPDFT